MKWSLFLALLSIAPFAGAQDFKVEFDKNQDLTHYKTFSFGDGGILTQKDHRVVPDSMLHLWIKAAVTEALVGKGLKYRKDSSDLVVSYISESHEVQNSGRRGPLALSPGESPNSTYELHYRIASLVVDLNDARGNKLVWRINATFQGANPDSERYIDEIVGRGFRKFSIHPRRQKKKK